MKDRALRRHQDFKTKIKKQSTYSACIGDRPGFNREVAGQNIEKLKKACVISHYDHHSSKTPKKTVQERRHDISMAEQLEP